MKKIICGLLGLLMLLSLTSCDVINNFLNKESEAEDTPPPVEETQNVEEVSHRTMIVDTAAYRLTFEILGEWREYAGTSPIRGYAQAVLASTSEINSTGNTFFYVVIERHQDSLSESGEPLSFKDHIVNQIKESNDSVEFVSITDSSTDTVKRAIAIYNIADGNDNIKHYQYTTVMSGYQISFIYSAPDLIYDNQRGYINDMIETAQFTPLNQTPAAEVSAD